MTTKKPFTSKAYREKTGATAPKAATELRKTQLEISSKINGALKTGPKTIPEIAETTGLPSAMVMWYLMTYYKYDLVRPVGKTEEGYYQYALRPKGG